MLDLEFREDLLAILEHAPQDHSDPLGLGHVSA